MFAKMLSLMAKHEMELRVHRRDCLEVIAISEKCGGSAKVFERTGILHERDLAEASYYTVLRLADRLEKENRARPRHSLPPRSLQAAQVQYSTGPDGPWENLIEVDRLLHERLHDHGVRREELWAKISDKHLNGQIDHRHRKRIRFPGLSTVQECQDSIARMKIAGTLPSDSILEDLLLEGDGCVGSVLSRSFAPVADGDRAPEFCALGPVATKRAPFDVSSIDRSSAAMVILRDENPIIGSMSGGGAIELNEVGQALLGKQVIEAKEWQPAGHCQVCGGENGQHRLQCPEAKR